MFPWRTISYFLLALIVIFGVYLFIKARRHEDIGWKYGVLGGVLYFAARLSAHAADAGGVDGWDILFSFILAVITSLSLIFKRDQPDQFATGDERGSQRADNMEPDDTTSPADLLEPEHKNNSYSLFIFGLAFAALGAVVIFTLVG